MVYEVEQTQVGQILTCIMTGAELIVCIYKYSTVIYLFAKYNCMMLLTDEPERP